MWTHCILLFLLLSLAFVLCLRQIDSSNKRHFIVKFYIPILCLLLTFFFLMAMSIIDIRSMPHIIPFLGLCISVIAFSFVIRNQFDSHDRIKKLNNELVVEDLSEILWETCNTKKLLENNDFEECYFQFKKSFFRIDRLLDRCRESNLDLDPVEVKTCWGFLTYLDSALNNFRREFNSPLKVDEIKTATKRLEKLLHLYEEIDHKMKKNHFQ